MTTTTHPAVAEYVAKIQTELADLPAAEVEEIVEDIGQHLSEIADELGEQISVEALTERLGTPEQYAAELRAAAGYPPGSGAPPVKPGTFAARVALWGLALGVLAVFLVGSLSGTARDSDFTPLPLLLFGAPLLIGVLLVFSGNAPMPTIMELPEYRAVAETWRRFMASLPDTMAAYLRSLRPAWWPIRIAVLVIAAQLALWRDTERQFVGLLSVVAIVALLWFGKRARTDRRWWWAVSPANAFAFGVGLALLGSVWSEGGFGYQPVNYYQPPPYGLNLDGRYLNNVYVFGPDGKPLPEVYLYDQDGQPISVPRNGCYNHAYGRNGEYGDGRTNKFPQPRTEHDDYGACRELTGVPFTVAIPQADPTTPAPSSPPASTPPTTSVPPPSK